MKRTVENSYARAMDSLSLVGDSSLEEAGLVESESFECWAELAAFLSASTSRSRRRLSAATLAKSPRMPLNVDRQASTRDWSVSDPSTVVLRGGAFIVGRGWGPGLPRDPAR